MPTCQSPLNNSCWTNTRLPGLTSLHNELCLTYVKAVSTSHMYAFYNMKFIRMSDMNSFTHIIQMKYHIVIDFIEFIRIRTIRHSKKSCFLTNEILGLSLQLNPKTKHFFPFSMHWDSDWRPKGTEIYSYAQKYFAQILIVHTGQIHTASN